MEKIFSGLHRVFQTDLSSEELTRLVRQALDKQRFALTLNGQEYFIHLPYTPDALKVEKDLTSLSCDLKFYCASSAPAEKLNVKISYNLWESYSRFSSFLFLCTGGCVERIELDDVESRGKLINLFHCSPAELVSIFQIRQKIDQVIQEKIEESSFDFNELDLIKWRGLNADQMYSRHFSMDHWKELAEAHLHILSRGDAPEAQAVNKLLSGLANKTSAKGILLQAEEISKLLNLPNPLVVFCTQNKRAGLLGIDHVTAITLVPLIPESFSSSVNLALFHFNCKEVAEKHDLMMSWHRALENYFEHRQFKSGEREKIKHNLSLLQLELRGDTSISIIKQLVASLEQDISGYQTTLWADEVMKASLKASFVMGKSDKSVNGLIHILFIVFLSLRLKS